MVVEEDQANGLLCTWIDDKKIKQSGVFAATSLRRPVASEPQIHVDARVPNVLFVIWYYLVNLYKIITYIGIFSILVRLLKQIVTFDFSERTIDELQMLAVATILSFILTMYAERLEKKLRR